MTNEPDDAQRLVRSPKATRSEIVFAESCTAGLGRSYASHNPWGVRLLLCALQ